MSLLTTATENFQFPLLGFTTDGDFWGFPDRDILTIADPSVIKGATQDGMVLIDNGGEQWVVRSVRTNGRAQRWGFWSVVFNNPPAWRVVHEIEKLQPVSLDEIRERCCAAVCVSWQDSYEADGREEEFAALLAQVRSARDVAHIYDILGIDEFAGM